MAQKKTSILSKVRRKSLELLTAGAMASGVLSGCSGDGPTKPIPPPPTNQSPTASFTANPNAGYSPLTANFNGAASQDPDGSIVKYVWEFGDDSADSTSGVSVSHMYSQPGNPNSCLTVVDNKGATGSRCEQLTINDASPSINVSDFSFNEDEQYNLDLAGKVTSPIYGNSGLKVTGTSPNLEVIVSGNGFQASVKNKVKDWNGSTYIDFTVEDQDGRKTTKRTNVNEIPQTDVRGYFEDVLKGTRIPGVPISYKGVSKGTSDSNGNFDFQVPTSSDTLKVMIPMTSADSSKFEDKFNVRFFKDRYYNFALPVSVANGQDITLNKQLIQRCKDLITGEDLLEFMKKYMLPSRWDDADLPVKVFIDNNPPSPEYREAVRQGIMSWDAPVNAWLPEARKLTMAQIVSTDPEKGIRVDYSPSNTGGSFEFVESFKNGLLKMNPTQVPNAAVRTSAHEFEHGIFGPKLSPFDHSPYSNHLLSGGLTQVLPSPFEGLVVATKYKLKKDATGLYSR